MLFIKVLILLEILLVQNLIPLKGSLVFEVVVVLEVIRQDVRLIILLKITLVIFLEVIPKDGCP